MKFHLKTLHRWLLLGSFTLLIVLFLPQPHPVYATTNCANTDVPQIQCEALMAIYNATGGANWNTNTGWGQTNTVCDWAGVVCNWGIRDRVEKLYLSYNNLTGSLPAEIGHLPDLIQIEMLGNQLTGLPAEIGTLSNLIELEVIGNQLTGLPPEIGNLSNLQILHLDNNQLSSLPAEIGNLSSLKSLSFSYNNITSLPDTIGNLSSLTEIILSNIPLVSLPETFGNLSGLTNLYLIDIPLTNLPTGFGNLTGLQSLHIRNSGLTSLPENFGSLTGLISIEIESSPLASLPESFGSLLNLQSLTITNTPLASLPESFGSLTNLQYLFITNTPLASLPDNFGSLTSLFSLSIHDSSLSTLPESFGALSNLQYLSLYDNPLTNLPDNIGNLSLLQGIYIYNINLTSLPESFGNLGSLTTLEIFNTPLTGLPESFGNLNGLTRLSLVNGQMTALPDSFANLIKLDYLDISGNQITSLPVGFGNLTKLTGLHVGYNRLTSLPDEIGNLHLLRWLNAHSNQLTDLPLNLGSQLLLLGDLDVSHNNLIHLPASLLNINTLQTLKINNNALEDQNLAYLLVNYLDTHVPSWRDTQTIPPSNIVVSNTTAVSVKLSWTPIVYTGEAGYYEVGVSTTSGSGYVFDEANRKYDKTSTGTTINGLTPNTPYYFVVRTVTNIANQPTISLNSAQVSATTLQNTTPPSETHLKSPDSGELIIGNPSPSFSWFQNSSDEQVTDYHLTVKNSAGTLVYQQSFPASEICVTGICSVDFATLVTPVKLVNGAHTWFVRAINAVGATTSITFSFTIQYPGAVTVVSPVSGSIVNDATPEFVWNANPATQYSIRVFSSSAVLLSNSGWLNSADVCDTGICRYSPALPFANGNFVGYVLARDTTVSTKSFKSVAINFKVAFPGAVTLISPIEAVIVPVGNPTLTWSLAPVHSATTLYRVKVLNRLGTAVYLSDWVSGATCTTQCEHVPVTLNLRNGTYTWFVQAKDLNVAPNVSKTSKGTFKVRK